MDSKNILVISDTQFPYDREDYLPFCEAVRDKYGCGRVIHIGDVADCLNFSAYERDPDAPSIPSEVNELRERFDLWGAVFPKVECVVGNHDRRIRRRLDSAGFSEAMLSTEVVFREALGLPEGWTLNDRIKVETANGLVMFLHGDERGSSVVPGLTMRKLGCSLVRGHHHTRAFIFLDSTYASLRFDMMVGCGIDKDAIAFKYNKKDISRPIYACGVILDGEPILVPMRLGKDGKWTGEL